MIEVTLTTPDEKRDMIKHIESSIDVLEEKIFQQEKERALSGFTRRRMLGTLSEYDRWVLDYSYSNSDVRYLEGMRKRVALALRYNETIALDKNDVSKLDFTPYKS